MKYHILKWTHKISNKYLECQVVCVCACGQNNMETVPPCVYIVGSIESNIIN